MMKLIFFEVKKMIKKKSNLVIIMLLLLLPGVNLFQILSDVRISPDVYDMNIEGIYVGDETYKNLEALQYIDHYLHSFSGEINDAWRSRVEEAKTDLFSQADEQREIDENEMIRLYGEDWKTYYEKGEQGELTAKELDALMNTNDAVVGSKDEDAPVRLKLRYTSDFRKLEGSIFYLIPKTNAYENPAQYLVTQEKLDIITEYRNKKLTNDPIPFDETVKVYADLQGRTQEEINFYNDKYLNQPYYYDSTMAVEVIQQLFSNTIYIFITIMLLGMLLINVFNQEYEYKTDQLLHPTKQHMGKQALAKIMYIFIFVIGVFLYQILVYFGVVHVLIGFHDWNVIYQSVIFYDEYFYPIYTCKEIILSCTIMFLSTSIFIAGLISFLSSFAKRSFSAILVYIFIILLVSIPAISKSSTLTRLSTVLPISAFQPAQLFNFIIIYGVPNINVITFGSCAIPLWYILVPVYLLFSFTLTFSAGWYFKKRQIKNA